MNWKTSKPSNLTCLVNIIGPFWKEALKCLYNTQIKERLIESRGQFLVTNNKESLSSIREESYQNWAIIFSLLAVRWNWVAWDDTRSQSSVQTDTRQECYKLTYSFPLIAGFTEENNLCVNYPEPNLLDYGSSLTRNSSSGQEYPYKFYYTKKVCLLEVHNW